jgi:N-acetylmuramoyl-L-alanine amidase
VSVNGTIVSLPAPVVVRDGEVYVPADALGRLVSAFEPPQVIEAPPGAIPVEVRLAGSAEELRVIIAGDQRLRPTLEGRANLLRIGFGEGVFLLPPYARRTVGGMLLERIDFEQTTKGTVLELVPGPAFRTAHIDTSRRGKQLEVVIGGVSVRSGRSFLGAQSEAGIRRVVIDPGHGGSEEGAVGPGGIKEKDVTLQVAKKLRSKLLDQGFEVELTRSVDRELGLDERAAIANNRRADLFLSLHANASPRTNARGAETYFLAREATDDVARTTAALENDAARRGRKSGGDDAAGLDLVLWDLAQVEYLEESAALAATIQEELNQALGLTDRGVRQAPFRVLMGATMPAVLVEMGFLSNEEEELRRASAAYQERLAGAVGRAVVGFRESYERRLGVSRPRGRKR